YTGNPIFTNCTIAGNTSSNRGGGIHIDHYWGGLASYFTNCVIWDNSPENVALGRGGATITYSDVGGGWQGEGNINADPQFVNPTSDLHLTESSLCIDAGDNDAPELPPPTLTPSPESWTVIAAATRSWTWALMSTDVIVRGKIPGHITGEDVRRIMGGRERPLSVAAALFWVLSGSQSPANGEHISSRTLMKGARIVKRGRLFSSPRLRFAPDNVTLATLDSHDQALCLWHTDNSKLLFRLESHKTMCGPLLFTPDTSTLAVGCRNAEVELWDVVTGKLLKTLKHNKRRYSETSCLAASPDGMTLAAATHNTIGLWDVPEGKLKRTMSGHSTVVEEMVFTPDGDAIVSGEDGGIIKWWNAGTGTLAKTLPQRPEWVGIIAFSPSAKTMATGRDFGLTLWDTESGKPLRRLTKGGYYVGISQTCEREKGFRPSNHLKQR
ncbi:MAG: hypothetical protein ACYTG0_02525, partial [Planctomycetota bacterium]